jgi:hypothetical protein
MLREEGSSGISIGELLRKAGDMGQFPAGSVRTDCIQIRLHVKFLRTYAAGLFIVFIEQETALLKYILEACVGGINPFDSSIAQQIDLPAFRRLLPRSDLKVIALALRQIQVHLDAGANVAIDSLAPLLPHLVHFLRKETHLQWPLREVWDSQKKMEIRQLVSQRCPGSARSPRNLAGLPGLGPLGGEGNALVGRNMSRKMSIVPCPLEL